MHCEHCQKELTKEEQETKLRIGFDSEPMKLLCRKCQVDLIKVACKSIGFHLGA